MFLVDKVNCVQFCLLNLCIGRVTRKYTLVLAIYGRGECDHTAHIYD